MNKENVNIEALELKSFNLKIKGTSPLLMHKFSDDAKEQMLGKQIGQAKQKKLRDIDAEVEQATHYTMVKGKKVPAFPACGFKKAIVEAAPYLDKMDKKKVKGSLQIPCHMIPLTFGSKEANEAMVRLSGRGNVAMVRYRPQFNDWECELPIRYNAKQISAEQIVALANLAGFHIGIGEWTPQRSGCFGMFEVVA